MLTTEIAVKQGFTNRKCPKCGGNTFIDKDIYGWHEQCLQCGRGADLPDVIEFFKQRDKDKPGLTEVSKS